jgi:hypothetical protein
MELKMQTQKRKITIVTRLHKGISAGNAGIPVEIWEWNDDEPHDLINAVETLQMERESNERSWGNIGCGHSWIEIDGMAINDTHLHSIPKRSVWERLHDMHQGLTVPEAREILRNPAEYAVGRP